MLKLFKMLQQIVSQLEQIRLKPASSTSLSVLSLISHENFAIELMKRKN